MSKQPIDMMMDGVQWVPAPEQTPDASGLPHVTHSGELDLLGKKLRCFRLSDGRAVIHADDFKALWGID